MQKEDVPLPNRVRASILVVDDDKFIRESLRELLEQEGYCVVTAENGLDALRHFAQSAPKPSLILLDMSMPVMDGTTFIQEFGQRFALPKTPILIMTAGAAGLPDYVSHRILRKPFDVERLIQVIAHELGALTSA